MRVDDRFSGLLRDLVDLLEHHRLLFADARFGLIHRAGNLAKVVQHLRNGNRSRVARTGQRGVAAAKSSGDLRKVAAAGNIDRAGRFGQRRHRVGNRRMTADRQRNSLIQTQDFIGNFNIEID